MAYAYSTDEEVYRGPADSVEDALALAIEECDPEPGQTIWVGRIVEPNMKYLLPGAEHIVEGMCDRAYDEYGEHSESWMDRLTKAQIDDLDDMLHFAITDWMKRHRLEPKFYGIEDAQAHVIPVPAEDVVVDIL